MHKKKPPKKYLEFKTSLSLIKYLLSHLYKTFLDCTAGELILLFIFWGAKDCPVVLTGESRPSLDPATAAALAISVQTPVSADLRKIQKEAGDQRVCRGTVVMRVLCHPSLPGSHSSRHLSMPLWTLLVTLGLLATSLWRC